MATVESENTVKVIIRTRPTQHFATNNIRINLPDDTISIFIPRNQKEGLINNQKEQWSFHFDKILHNVPQEEVFEYTMNDILKSSVQGYNGTIFAYGQTGSGKTFTISGAPSNFAYRGIIPRSISRLFNEISTKPEYEFNIQISYLEIYNEIMFDLLPEDGKFLGERANIEFQEDNKGNVIVKGLTKHKVTNEEECFNLLFEGESNRTISEHKLNQGSSRSHCLFMIQLEMKSKIESTEKIMVSKLNFVDLAGSERVKKTGSTGVTLKEATYINRSLTFLEQVVVALTERKGRANDHVPYRQSKLTHILKDAIGGNCKTIMIATIWPEEQFILDTLSTLNFAKRMKNVVNDLSVNIMLDKNAYVKKLNKEIKELKKELLMHNTLANRGKINYDPYTPEEQYIQQQIALKFLNGESEDIEFDSIRQAKELFIQCRIIFQKEYNGTKIDNESQAAIERKKTLIEKEREKTLIDNEKGVGDFEEKPSFGIGRAPKDARPIYKPEQANTNIQSPGLNTLMKSGEIKNLNSGDININLNDKNGININVIQGQNDADVILDGEEEKLEESEEIPPERIPDKNTGFQIYKSENENAKRIEEDIINTTTELKKLKDEARNLGQEGNKFKEQIDNINSALKNKQQNKLNLADEMTNVIDDEECKLIDQLKDIRKNYKETVEKFKQTKVQINELKNNLDLLKIKYVDSFENWFYKKYHIRVEEHELRLAKAKYGVNAKEEIAKEKISDPEEEAYNNAKKKIQSIHKAKRMEKKIS